MSLVRLSAADVGSRVVVRHRLADGSATDVVGELLELDDVTVRVRPDDRGAVAVARGDVVAAKAVPPRVVRPSSSPDDVQRVADLGWPGLDRRRLGGWVLRAGGGFTGRANSALAVGDPGLPLPEAISTVEDFYTERGLAPRVQVPFTADGPSDPAPGVDAHLAASGWTADATTWLMTAGLGAATEPSGADDTVELDPEPDDAWLARYSYRGGPVPPVAREVLLAAPWRRFGSVRRDGRTVAVGRVAVARGWAGVTAMTVDPAARRQGLGAAVLAALLRAGREQGARWAYLQVVADNADAVRLYRAAGFRTHHAYHYRTRPTS